MQTVASGLLSAQALADLLAISPRTLRRLDSAGRLPRAVRIGTQLKRWRRDEIVAWIEADCPPLNEWSWNRTDR